MADELNPYDLIGAFASSTLSEDERRSLFSAALEDQELFDELANEAPLLEVLSDTASTSRLLAALSDDRPASYDNGLLSWFIANRMWLAGFCGAALVVLVLSITVRRYQSKPSSRSAPVDQTGLLTTTTTVGPTPAIKDIVARYIDAARYAIQAKDYGAARDDINAALEIDPSNRELLAKKKEIEEIVARASQPGQSVAKAFDPGQLDVPAPAPITNESAQPTMPDVQESAGIPRRANETPAEYMARAARVQLTLREGVRALEQQNFPAALSWFQEVDRGQKGYMNVDRLIENTLTTQKRLVDDTIEKGQQDERAGELAHAITSYETALRFDPRSADAQQKLASLEERRTTEGLKAFELAQIYRQRNDTANAITAYQEAFELLPSTSEKKAEASQWLSRFAPTIFPVGAGAVRYGPYRDASGRFEIDQPTMDWHLLPVSGSAVAIFAHNNRAATVVIDLAGLTEPLGPNEIATNAQIEIDTLKEQQPNAKDFSVEPVNCKSGNGALIKYSRIGTTGTERVLRYLIAVDHELYRLDATVQSARYEEFEPVLMHMIQSFKAPAAQR